MIFPLSTDQPLIRRPIVTNTLITANLLAYLAMTLGAFLQWSSRDSGVLLLGAAHSTLDQPWRLVTYQFVHDPDDLLHLLFNMLFLWIFGRNVECRMGRWTFAFFYLLGGVVAALAHMSRSEAVIVGASGSICAVTGAFIVLFPRSRIKIFVFFLVIGVFMIPSMWFVAFYMVTDLLQQTMEILGRNSSHVAYLAHLAGYACGIAASILLLAAGRIPRSQSDMLYLLKQRRRRRAYRSAIDDTASPLRREPTPVGRSMTPEKEPVQIEDPAVIDARVIARCLSQSDAETARRRFAAACAQGREVLLAPVDLKSLATECWAAGDIAEAVTAWRQYIRTAPDADDLPQVQLMTAAAIIRHLDHPEDASSLLDAALDRLTDPDQRALVATLREEMTRQR